MKKNVTIKIKNGVITFYNTHIKLYNTYINNDNIIRELITNPAYFKRTVK